MRRAGDRITDEMLSRLAAGGGGADIAQELCAVQESRNRLLVSGIVQEAARLRHEQGRLAADAYALLADIEPSAPKEVRRAFRYPAVGAWALRCYASLAGGDPAGAEPGRLGAVAAAVAIRSRTPCRLRIPARRGTFMLPGLGRVVLPSGVEGPVDVEVHPGPLGARLGIGRSAVEVDLAEDRPGWKVLHRVSPVPGVDLVLDDLDGYRWPETGAARPRLPGGEREHWASCLREAWRILASDHRTVAAEVASAVSVLTPLASPAHGQNSGSARETFGTVALSRPVGGLTLAATFAHEIQHAKLTALLDVVPLTRPGHRFAGYAPWRDDPRPVYGLLQGAYAFLGVAGFWRRRRQAVDGTDDSYADAQFARWRDGAHLVTGTLLRSGGLTERGHDFVTGMRATLEHWRAEPVPAGAAARARQEAERHREAWERRNPGFV
ncbi:HEXXH motif domain-containing protein [Sphaerisporangium perillae]|uniref:HEXXH motif domain-containing protein n=1 Tax=Sphaerisporangium perillae TaxID=2935860 RepID=UPI00200DBC0A|nr:HEXXH motif domain-containing protein [Sphaerisporangium perillae]